LNPAEPKPEATAPPCPPKLSKGAKKIWAAMVDVVGAGVITRDNGEPLARYCHALARWWKMAEWLDGNDDTYTVFDQQHNTRHVRHPNVITYEKLSRDLLRMEQEFGLTPASRTRVAALVSTSKPKEAQAAPANPTLRIAQ
jgi:P27 family predicted phage terminase small subunit